MRAKYLWIIFLTSFVLYSCDDNTGNLGLGILPPSDDMVVGTATYTVTTKSIESGPVFAKTNVGYIGKFSDPEFGFYETEFLTQFNCVGDIIFPEAYSPGENTGDRAIIDNKIKKARLRIWYADFFGDPLAPSRLNIYELNKNLRDESYYYTDIDPTNYYNENDLLVSEMYIAKSDSVSYDRNGYFASYYQDFELPQELGQYILDSYRQHPEYFISSETFIENVFKGIYLKTVSGDGSILYVDDIDLQLIFDCYMLDEDGTILQKVNETDSINTYAKTFSSSKEVVQAHRFINSNKIEEKVEETEWTYIKSPAAILTEVSLPILEIAKEHKKDTLNTVGLTFSAYQQEDDEYTMTQPDYLLMIPKCKMKEFFEENKLPDNESTYITNFISSGKNANEYYFTNISNLITSSINQKNNAQKEAGNNWNEEQWIEENQWGKVVLIPVARVLDDPTSASATLIGIYHDLKPGYVKLRGGDNELDMKVVYTRFPLDN